MGFEKGFGGIVSPKPSSSIADDSQTKSKEQSHIDTDKEEMCIDEGAIVIVMKSAQHLY